MPYASNKQRRFFHTKTAQKKGISQETVKEFDQASKGMKLPESAHSFQDPAKGHKHLNKFKRLKKYLKQD